MKKTSPPTNKNKTLHFYDWFSKYYEWYYREMDAEQIVDRWFDALLKAGLRMSGKLVRFLDVGCGPGWHIKSWLEKGFDVSGLDGSSKMARLARKNLKAYGRHATIYVKDITDLSGSAIRRKKFDVLAAHFNFLNFFTEKQLVSMFENISLLAEPGSFCMMDYLSRKYARTHNLAVQNYNINGEKITQRDSWDGKMFSVEQRWEKNHKPIAPGVTIWLHPHTLYKQLLKKAGWIVVERRQSHIVSGKLILEPFTVHSNHVVIIAKKIG